MRERGYLVSAIVSVYNCERFIRECLDDLLRQTIADRVEIVIVNSGSQQNEERIIEEYQKEHDNIVYVKTDRESLYQAWNRGIRLASGKYITNANADDRHRKDAFEVMSKVLEEDYSIDVVYGDDIITEKENETFEKHTFAGELIQDDFNRERLLYRCYLSCHPMWRKSIHERFGYFDETLDVSGDYEFWLRIAEECNFKHVREHLGLYFKSLQSVERRNPMVTLLEKEQVLNKYISRIKHNKKLISAVYKKLSSNWSEAGYIYIGKDSLKSARQSFAKSIRYDCTNYKSYLGFIVSCLPNVMIRRLRLTKRFIQNTTSIGSIFDF